MRLRGTASDAELTALALEYLQQVIPELPNGAADAARQVLESAQNLARHRRNSRLLNNKCFSSIPRRLRSISAC